MLDEAQMLVEDISSLLWTIQSSRKGSIGYYNVYLPQLDCANVDDIVARLNNLLGDGVPSDQHIAIVRDGDPVAEFPEVA